MQNYFCYYNLVSSKDQIKHCPNFRTSHYYYAMPEVHYYIDKVTG